MENEAFLYLYSKTIFMQLLAVNNKIFELRGKKIMLDFDLAALYEMETKVLKQAVRRNIERFPEILCLPAEGRFNLLKMNGMEF